MFLSASIRNETTNSIKTLENMRGKFIDHKLVINTIVDWVLTETRKAKDVQP